MLFMTRSKKKNNISGPKSRNNNEGLSKNFGESIRYKRRKLEERMAREDALRDIEEDELNEQVRRIFTKY